MLITFEGLDFSGKSTHAMQLHKALDGSHLVRDPGGTQISEKIRDILLSEDSGDLATWTEIYLYLAARSQLVKEKITPLLESGQTVISDRFSDSTIAYQFNGQKLGETLFPPKLSATPRGAMFVDYSYIDTVVEISPDLTFYMRLDIDEFIKRRNEAIERGEVDKADCKPISFFESVLEKYDDLAREHERIRVIDATQDFHANRKKILDISNTEINGLL